MKTTEIAKTGTMLILTFLLLSLPLGGGAASTALAQDPEEEAPTVEIPLEKQQLIGVKTVAARVQPLSRTIRTVGRIAYDERKLATVNTKFEGWIDKLYADYEGMYVKKGEPLAELYSPELFATQQEFLSVLRSEQTGTSGGPSAAGGLIAQDTGAIIRAARERLRLWDITDEQIEQIARTGKVVRTLTIYSPVDGYLVRKTALQGTRVMPGQALFDVADLSTVWVVSDIYEYELPLVREGQTARISLSYIPGREFTSRIDYIYPTLSGNTRTVKVRFTIPNPGGRLKPRMYTNVEVKIDLGKRLAIPEDAVIDTGERQVVYVDQGDGFFEHRTVTLGVRADGMVEILRGVKAGEKVATAAAFLIDSEAKIRGIVK